VNYLCVPTEARNQEAGYLTVFGDRKTLPFRKGVFDIVVYPLALQSWLFQDEHIKGVSRLLKNGGQLILSTRHPQLEQILFNQNPAESMISEDSLMRQFRLLRDHHLFTEDLAEGVVDLSLRPFFCMEGEYDFYHDYKGTPISLAFKAVKYVRGGG
jgi:SAM-dependent methyltransferase